MKKLIFFNQIFLAGDRAEYSSDEKIRYAGLNTGNIVYVEALKKQLLYDKELWFDDNIVEDKLNYIGIIPCANMIGIHDICTEKWAEFIERWDIPTTLVGIGAQSTSDLNTPKKLVSALPKNKIRALRKISERVTSIGIRGDFTAECLEIMGIVNYKIIGCPSLYSGLTDHYKEMNMPSTDKCVMNLLPYCELASKILNLGISNNCKWIMQEASEMPKTVLDNKPIEQKHINSKFPNSNISRRFLESYMRSNAKIFFDINKWSDYLIDEKFTFSFGSRFHGNAMSLLNGIPALWITHDSRTQELVDTFALPYITREKFYNIKGIKNLMEYCQYDNFYRKYEKMYKIYVEFLDENNIPH